MTQEELKEMIKTSIMNEMHCANEVREQEEEIETEETEEIEIEDDGSLKLSPEEQEVQTALEKALDAAKKLGNPKLVTQIGNTITFFTRSEIIKEEKTEEDIRAKFLRTLRIPNNAL
jgi:hypothetical protein